MTQLPSTFRNRGENQLATFNFDDIANGVGQDNYYPTADSLTGGPHYSVTTQLLNAGVIETATVNGALTINFDSSAFNLPRTVKGNVELAYYWFQVNAESPNFTFQLKKWDGATATALTATSNPTYSEGLNQAYLTIPITATGSDAIIKRGEQLRLIFTGTASGTGSYLGHSPTNQTSANLTAGTKFTMAVPYKIIR